MKRFFKFFILGVLAAAGLNVIIFLMPFASGEYTVFMYGMRYNIFIGTFLALCFIRHMPNPAKPGFIRHMRDTGLTDIYNYAAFSLYLLIASLYFSGPADVYITRILLVKINLPVRSPLPNITVGYMLNVAAFAVLYAAIVALINRNGAKRAVEVK